MAEALPAAAILGGAQISVGSRKDGVRSVNGVGASVFYMHHMRTVSGCLFYGSKEDK